MRKVMLYYFRVIALAVLASIPGVAQTKVIACSIEPTHWRVNDNPFSQDNELRVQQVVIDLIQRDQLDMTRIVPPPEFRAHPVGDAKQIKPVLPLMWESGNCRVADRAPNGSLQFH